MNKWMMLAPVILVMGTTPVSANNRAVFLNCELTTGSSKLVMQVQLNEPAGTASYTFPKNGDSFSVRAIFAPDKVSFGAFVISRTNLVIQRINNGRFDQSVYGLAPVDYGQCAIDDRARAF